MENVIYPAPSKPMSVARHLVADVFTRDGAPTLVRRQHTWYMFNGKSWSEQNEETVKGPIWARLEHVYYESSKGGAVEFNPTPAKVRNVMEPLAYLTGNTESLQDANPPMWIQGADEKPPADHLIVMANGVLNYRTREFTPGHDSNLFTLWHLPFDYDPDATCPTWMKLLAEVFDHDRAAHEAFQEFAGYLISGRTDHQKALMLIGPSGGGKGTISKTIQGLVGEGNVVAPSLSGMGGNFGQEPLIGKTLAVLEDARADHSASTGAAVEKLLNIVGEDSLTIDRKNQKHWQGKLPTRVMLISNEVPRLPDSSGAILRRFVAIKLKRSFKEKADKSLPQRLAAEMPGIFNWALEGLDRLERQGKFTVPATQAEVTQIMSDLSQPVATFLDDNDRFTLTGNPEDHVLLRDIHAAYRKWCEAVGASPLKQANFAQALTATDPAIEFKNTAVDGHRKARRIFGVGVRKQAHVWEISQQTA